MIVSTTYRCEICNAVRGESNNWFMGVMLIDEINIYAFPSNPSESERDRCVALCGESCVTKYVSSNLNKLHEDDVENY
jgi:hypothetical protein